MLKNLIRTGTSYAKNPVLEEEKNTGDGVLSEGAKAKREGKRKYKKWVS